MRVLLTGATGFVGSHLLVALNKAGHRLVAIKRPSSVLPLPIRGIDNVNWIDNDQELTAKLKALDKFDAVIHLATNYGNKSRDWVEVERDNVELPLLLLQYAVGNDCGMFINTDTFFSRKAYSYSHMEEYILTKQHFAAWGELAALKTPGFAFINARLEHVYGPSDRSQKFIPWLFKSLAENINMLELTAGDQRRDFIYIDDVVSAYKCIIDNSKNMVGYIEAGVGTGKSIALKDFVLMAKHMTFANTELHFGAKASRPGEILDSAADTRFLESFGWTAKVGLSEGIGFMFNEAHMA